MPVEVGPGAEVYAASINGGGALELEVTARTDESSLARIVRIVEDAQERKGRSQRLAERVARPLVPAVLVAAALIAIVGSLLGDPSEWILRSRRAGSARRIRTVAVVLLERVGETLGAIAVRDELRPEAAEAVDALRGQGLNVAMLTGDNRRTAHALAAEAGIGVVRAELLPEDKVSLVRDLRAAHPTATASTTRPRSRPRTWASPWARSGPTSRSRPRTSR